MASGGQENADACRRLVAVHETHARAVFRFLLELTGGDRSLAEDLVQETMLRVWRRLDTLPAADESVRGWLFTIARRVAVDAARRRRVRPVEVSLAEAGDRADADDAVGEALALHAIRVAFARLRADQRAVLRELHLEGRSTAETAARLGVPVGTVKSRAFHALRSLRAGIEADRS